MSLLPADRCQMPVLFEDEHLLAFDKPADLPSAAHAPDDVRTAAAQALAHCPALAGVGPKATLEPGLLHRLDNGTSGVLLFAKTNDAFERVRAAWKTASTDKIYRAIVLGAAEAKPPGELPLILTPTFAHDAKSARKMRIVKETTRASAYRGKPMPTESVLEVLTPLKGPGGPLRFDAQVRIQTGVQHQVRLTLADLGLPILGDAVYGEKGGRLWLHHWRLLLLHPVTNQALQIEAPLPSGWPRG